MLIPALRELGFEVWAIHPTGEYKETLGEVEINPYQPVLDACYADGPSRKDAVKYVADIAELHLPTQSGEKNPYFTGGSRRAIASGHIEQGHERSGQLHANRRLFADE